MPHYTKIISVLLLWLGATLASAAIAPTEAVHNTTSSFDLPKTRQQLQQIEQDLQNQQMTHQQLRDTRKLLEMSIARAEKCTSASKKKLTELNSLRISIDTEASGAGDKSSTFLDQAIKQEKEKLSDCELLIFEASELEKIISSEENLKTRNYQFTKNPPLWAIDGIEPLLKTPFYSMGEIIQLSGISAIEVPKGVLELLGTILISLLLSMGWFIVFKHLVKDIEGLKLLIPHFKKYIPAFLVVYSVHLFFTQQFSHSYPAPFIASISLFLLSITLGYIFVQTNNILFSYKKSAEVKLLTKKSVHGALCLIGFIFINSIVELLTNPSLLANANISLYTLFYLILLYSTLQYTLTPLFKLFTKRGILKDGQGRKLLIVLTMFFISAAVFTVLGYATLVNFIVVRLLKSLALFFISGELIRILWRYNNYVKDKTHPISIKFHIWMGIKTGKKLPELSILAFLLTVGIVRNTLYFLFHIWNLPIHYLVLTGDYISNNTSIWGMSFDPFAILKGSAVFCIVIAIGRLIGAYIARKSFDKEEKNSRITITTLSNYIAFVFAFFAALMVGGINLTGFALVASALSVGIGFGLKEIAADTVSGLILLLNRPLRPGDHIKVDATEGFIQEIKLLSTQIKTLDESNVNLPNSALLGKSVINYTYKSKRTRIYSQVMLENASDIKRATQIMLDIAKKHPDIEQKAKLKPEVVLELHAEKNMQQLILTLWCFIKDVDERDRVHSDINEKIMAAIEKENIPLKLK